MLDLGFIRENQEKVRETLKNRAPKLDFDGFLKLDAQRRWALKELEGLRAERNRANDAISQMIKEKKDPKETIGSMKAISQKIGEFESQVGEFDSKLREILLVIPNLPHSSVDFGVDSTQNKQVSCWGEPRKFDFKAKEHTELGESLGLFDSQRASKQIGRASCRERVYVLV